MMKLYRTGLFYLFTAFSACQEKSFTSISPSAYQTMQQKKGGVLVDVRTPEEYAAGHLANSENADWRGGQFKQEMRQWDKEKTYYLYCASGNRSGQAMQFMKEAGFKKVYNLGGYKDLETAGLPVEKK